MRNRPIPHLNEETKKLVRSLLIYQDETLLAFNKPSGLAVQTRGNRGTSLDHLLWAFARSNGKRPHLVHRIDAGTSGLVLAAKTKPAMTHYSTEFAERRVYKIYLALVSGTLPDTDAGRCDLTIRKTGRRVVAEPSGQGGDTAQTDWRILGRTKRQALIEAHPKTGRMHQIRAHLAAMGCPILGDPIYGEGEKTALRLMLHAFKLKLIDPHKKELALQAPVPKDFEKMKTSLGF